ncbi:hypothetical protein A2U01_0067105, partial [Trifolium medium]|nr:hypothetical protein [Trifolium medium]
AGGQRLLDLLLRQKVEGDCGAPLFWVLGGGVLLLHYDLSVEQRGFCRWSR